MKLFAFIAKRTWVKVLLIFTPAAIPATIAYFYWDATSALSKALGITNKELNMSLSERPKLYAQRNKAEANKYMFQNQLKNAEGSKEILLKQKQQFVNTLTKDLNDLQTNQTLKEMDQERDKLSEENNGLRSLMQNKNLCMVWFKLNGKHTWKRTNDCNTYSSRIKGFNWVRIK